MEPNMANICKFHCIFNNIIPPFHAVSWHPCHKHTLHITAAAVVSVAAAAAAVVVVVVVVVVE
jgi:hypothetical protein